MVVNADCELDRIQNHWEDKHRAVLGGKFLDYVAGGGETPLNAESTMPGLGKRAGYQHPSLPAS